MRLIADSTAGTESTYVTVQHLPDMIPTVPRPNSTPNPLQLAQAFPLNPARANYANLDGGVRTRAGRTSDKPAWLKDYET